MADQENETTQSAGSGSSAGTDAKTDQTGEQANSTAKDVMNKAKDSAGQAYGLVADKANSAISEQKSNLSSSLSGVADSIRQVAQNVGEKGEQNPVTDLTAKYTNTAADQIERLSGYFEQKDLREILRDVETFARRQPTVFVIAAFGVGVLAARFLKSSPPSASTGGQLKSRRNSKTLTGNAAADRVGNAPNQTADRTEINASESSNREV